ncbi:DUF3267 domain-containing protein [Halopiger xanaduensis]|uniref:DUF3267 domain-containing protein n=1 Tax=Halopiger xanaduensis (strain DSM 18323 / JCM 14033 / SH-6) TaxID=797210 RepID=F8DCS8_HALXS|nr:DUF3267 domain-containing protein [Halopiger xanaduensis]AEH37253.1 hypothetical protein Halxa_2636 [Halopiger xanaduensis SH-6]
MSRTASARSRPLAEFRLTRRVALQWLGTAVVGFFVFAYCFARLLAAIRGEALEPIVIRATPPTVHFWLVVSLGLVALVVVLHEALHGLVMTRYGDSPGFGLGVSYFVLPYAYAETRGEFTRNQLLAMLLAPFVAITILGVAAMLVYPSSVWLIPLATNAAGSIGDLWMAATLLQYPATVRVTELPTGGVQGFAIYGPEADQHADGQRGPLERRPPAIFLTTVLAGAAGTLAVLVGLGIVAVLASLAFGSGDVVIGHPDGRWFLFRHELGVRGDAHLEIGAASVLAVAAVGGIAWTLAAAVRGGLE